MPHSLDHEGTTTRRRTRRREVNIMLRVSSPLSEELEALVTDTIGCCIKVHRALGPGLLETIYSRAVAIELRAAGISFDREQRYPVRYRGELLCDQRLDFVVAGTL